MGFEIISAASLLAMTILLLILVVSTYSKSAIVPASPELIYNRSMEWKNLSTHFIHSQHKKRQQGSLSRAVGVYNDHSQSIHRKSPAIQETVLMTVIEYDHAQASKFRNLFLNWVCFVKEHNLKVLVYYLTQSCNEGDPQHIQALRQDAAYEHLNFIPYPYGLFWHFLSFKHGGSSNDMFLTAPSVECPTFKIFGSVITVVAKFEVILHGYSLIYLDVDMAFTQDPVPFIMQGTANINFGMEARDCRYPSRTFGIDHWTLLEPNTGVMHIRHSHSTKLFLRRWIREMIDGAQRNDQFAIQNVLEDDYADESCNPKTVVNYDTLQVPYMVENNTHLGSHHSHHLEHKPHGLRGAHSGRHHHNNIYEGQIHHILDSVENNTKITRPKIKYCFLNEFLFPNGMVGLHCSLGKKGGDQHDYMYSMKRMGSLLKIENKTTLSPVIVHANYVGNKERSLGDRGLWLLNETALIQPSERENVCKPFSIPNLFVSQPYWSDLFIEADKRYDESVAALKNGTVFRFEKDKSYTFYVYVNKVRRQIENKKMYFQMGFNESIVVPTSNYILQAIPQGKGIYDEQDLSSVLSMYLPNAVQV